MPEINHFRVVQEREVEVSAESFEKALETAQYAFDQYANNYAESGQPLGKVVKVNDVHIYKTN